MRFLLNPVLKTSKTMVRRHADGKAVSKHVIDVSKVSSDSNQAPSYTKFWGQQCSHNCGCVVRFEATVNPSTQEIVNATYHAKSIVATKTADGRLEPVRTNRTNKPMMKECKCKTIHTLAKEITTFVSNKNLDSVRNMSEFASTRSSPAFRHAVLVGNQLPRTDIHCFDVLEEAFTAMIKGFLPSQRRTMRSYDKVLAHEFSWKAQAEEQENDVSSLQRRHTGMDQTHLSMSVPRSVSTLSMFDINAEYWEQEEHQKMEQEAKQRKTRSLDWLSFVDEQYRNEKSAWNFQSSGGQIYGSNYYCTGTIIAM